MDKFKKSEDKIRFMDIKQKFICLFDKVKFIMKDIFES